MRNLGIDPLTLDPSDPAWSACWRPTRGDAVRKAADAVKQAGIDVRTPAGVLAVLDSVAAHVAVEASARRRLVDDVDNAPDDVGDTPDDVGDEPDDA